MRHRALTVLATAGGLGLIAVTVVVAEALVAARGYYLGPDSAPEVSAELGPSSGRPVSLVVLGDSTAAGIGTSTTADTVGARIAAGLAEDGRRVVLSSVAVSGARTADLAEQVSRAVAHGPPGVALVLVGANDATHRSRLAAVRRELGAAVGRLRAAGATVVVGTCPDMGTPVFLPPLRQLVAWRGRQVGSAEGEATRAAGGMAVDLAAAVGAAFRADPARLLSADRFHPSPEGYLLWSRALLPAVRRAAGTG